MIGIPFRNFKSVLGHFKRSFYGSNAYFLEVIHISDFAGHLEFRQKIQRTATQSPHFKIIYNDAHASTICFASGLRGACDFYRKRRRLARGEGGSRLTNHEKEGENGAERDGGYFIFLSRSFFYEVAAKKPSTRPHKKRGGKKSKILFSWMFFSSRGGSAAKKPSTPHPP